MALYLSSATGNTECNVSVEEFNSIMNSVASVIRRYCRWRGEEKPEYGLTQTYYNPEREPVEYLVEEFSYDFCTFHEGEEINGKARITHSGIQLIG